MSEEFRVVGDEYLKTEMALTEAFIVKHARKMGSFGRPRRYILKHVQAHLEELAQRSLASNGKRRKRHPAPKADAKQIFKEAVRMVEFRKRRGAA